jgi:DNA invertase Pin-like site-specific DNA recombinase
MAKTCLTYARVSSERQAGEDKTSHQNQIDACLAACAERGYEVPPDGIYTEVHTRTLLERPVLGELRRRVARENIDVVMAMVVDRVSGDMTALFSLMHELRLNGARLELARETFEDSSLGRFLMMTKALIAEVEVENTAGRPSSVSCLICRWQGWCETGSVDRRCHHRSPRHGRQISHPPLR